MSHWVLKRLSEGTFLKPALHLVPPSCPFMGQHQGGHFEKHTAHHYSKAQKAPCSTMWVS